MPSSGTRDRCFGPCSIKSGRFVEGGPGAGREFVSIETLQYIEKQIAKAKSVSQILTLLETGKTDKAATGWEIAPQPSASEEE